MNDDQRYQHLFKAVLLSDYETVTACLNEQPKLLSKIETHFKRSPLNMAIEKDDLEMVKILVSFEAKPFQKAYSDQYDMLIPPYHLAKKLGNKDICAFLAPLAKDKSLLFIDFSEK